MPLEPHARLGPYEITLLLGAGGMGEVYRAHDSRLGRDVAIKVLPARIAGDPQALARFEREARAVAALSHPNIIALFDISIGDATPYAVTELLEGETLRYRLKQGPVPLRKALDYGRQIADALAAAHDRGIVHRDLKPENIFLTADGRVKVLDFGLARVAASPSTDAGLTMATTPHVATSPGTILGTMGYMAPEQVRGQAMDHRTDIFALGAVLYEMFTGRRVFHGETPADVLSAVLHLDPAETKLADASMPPPIDQIVYRCLEKAPANRFQSARDLAFALAAAASGAPSGIERAGRARGRRGAIAIAACVAAVAALTAAFFAGRAMVPASGPPPTMVRFMVPANVAPLTTVGLSPDGRYLVYNSTESGLIGTSPLLLRQLDRLDSRVIAGTEKALWNYVWSPDSRYLAFFDDAGVLFRVALPDGKPQQVQALPGRVSGGSWGSGDVMLVGLPDGIYRLPAGGGTLERVLPIDTAREIVRGWPSFIDGERFLYSAVVKPGADEQSIETRAATLSGRELGVVLRGAIGARYADGHVLYGSNGALLARKFDAARLTLADTAVSLAPSAMQDWRSNRLMAQASSTGIVALRPPPTADVRFTWVDRHGQTLSTVGAVNSFTNFDVSPDGQRIITARRDPVTADSTLWLIEADRGVTSLVSAQNDAGIGDPTWAPDGRHVVFRHHHQLVMRLANGGEERVLHQGAGYPDSMTRDGRYVVYGEGRGPYFEMWALDILTPDAKPIPLVQNTTNADEGRFSPDGRWIAYHSTEGGSAQVFVMPFPPTGERWQISRAGGVQPRWSRDGNELFYLDPEGRLIGARMPGSDPRRAASPEILFATGLVVSSALDQYAAVGDRFLLRLPATTSQSSAPVEVLVNWPRR